jgi:hypothetical protein
MMGLGFISFENAFTMLSPFLRGLGMIELCCTTPKKVFLGIPPENQEETTYYKRTAAAAVETSSK